MSTWWEKAQRFYNEHGYLVISCELARPIGSRVTSFHLAGGFVVDSPQPFSVIARTTAEDYFSQFPDGGAAVAEHDSHCRLYYKIVTD